MDTTLNRDVAIKEHFPRGFVSRHNEISLTVTVTDDEEKDFFTKWNKRFRIEAQTLAKLEKIKHIVKVYDYFEENGTAYIVMEYLDGIKLNEFVKKSKPFSVDKIVSLMIPLLNSLNDLHDKNIIHRDISPDNIMLMPDGSLTLYDFGAAYEFSNQNQKSHFVAVKHGYAPPEQYGGKSEQGTWTDVYAICATIYYCITGQVPASSAERLNEDILSPPSAFGIHIEPYIEKSLLKGMSVDRKNRYQTVEKLAIALCNPPGVIVIPPEIRVDPPETEKKKVPPLPLFV